MPMTGESRHCSETLHKRVWDTRAETPHLAGFLAETRRELITLGTVAQTAPNHCL
jgi:hypothetical protein